MHPRFFRRNGRINIRFCPLFNSWRFRGAIMMSLWLPGKVYEYITTAAGLMILYNWSFILLSSRKLLKPSLLNGVKRWLGLVLIVLL